MFKNKFEGLSGEPEPTQGPSSGGLGLLSFMEGDSASLMDYLLAPRSQNLEVLNSQLDLKKEFVRLNCVLPSSAPVERLFSTGGLILTGKRSKLSDENFENLVLNKYNSKKLKLK